MIIAQVENGLGKHVKQLEKHEAMRQQQDVSAWPLEVPSRIFLDAHHNIVPRDDRRLQHLPLLHQTLDPTPVHQNISAKGFQARDLDSDGRSRHLRHLASPRRDLHLSTCSGL